MNKQIKAVYEEIKFQLGTGKLTTLLDKPDVDLGDFGNYTINQFLTIYNIYYKADKDNKNRKYSEKTADILFDLYKMSLDLDKAVINDPHNDTLRNRYYAILNILSIYGIRTKIDLNDIMKKQANSGCTNLPSEERLEELVKAIIPSKKA